jgi:hypothetical protein
LFGSMLACFRRSIIVWYACITLVVFNSSWVLLGFHCCQCLPWSWRTHYHIVTTLGIFLFGWSRLSLVCYRPLCMPRSFLSFGRVVLATLNCFGLGFVDLTFLRDWLRCPVGVSTVTG